MPEHDRALRVADEDDAAAVVVVLQVVAPCLEHVGEGDLARASRAAHAERGEPGERDLAIERRVDPALAGEAGGLEPRDRGDLRVRGLRGVQADLVGDRGVDVEAVDRSLVLGDAVGREDLLAALVVLQRRVEADLAGARLHPRLAEPLDVSPCGGGGECGAEHRERKREQQRAPTRSPVSDQRSHGAIIFASVAREAGTWEIRCDTDNGRDTPADPRNPMASKDRQDIDVPGAADGER